MANAGPGLLLHDAVSASPFFEMDTLPAGQVTEAIPLHRIYDRIRENERLTIYTCQKCGSIIWARADATYATPLSRHAATRLPGIDL